MRRYGRRPLAGACQKEFRMTDVDTMANCRFGFWAALATGITTTITFLIAILTPPLSGPLCQASCLRYPYLDAAQRFPRDYYWLFSGLVAILCYLAFMVALRGRASASGRPVAEFGLLMGGMAGLVLFGDYFVQLAVVQPSLLAGETDGIPLLTQYNPHGVFIALEELGYLLVGLSLACMIPALSRRVRLERFLRRLFLGGLVVDILALSFFLYQYGHRREYRFEIAVISIDWLVLIVGAFAMATVFRRDIRATVRASRLGGPGAVGNAATAE
jgi:hypothetical protein